MSGEHTASGKPIVCSDPHFANTLPSFWYQSELVSRDGLYNARGGSFVAYPGISLGTTDFFAWGLTSARTDTADLFLEKIEGENYLHDGEWKPLKKRHEVIRVRGGEDVPFTIYETHHGPVFKNLTIDTPILKLLQF